METIPTWAVHFPLALKRPSIIRAEAETKIQIKNVAFTGSNYMTRKYLLIGISTAALAAGVASAQNSSTTSPNCGPTASGLANTCNVDQGANANGNTSSIQIGSGTANNVTVTQPGQLNTSMVTINGSNNTVSHLQFGVLNNARTDIAGNNNTSTIQQAGTRNSASNNITGSRNTAFIQQAFNVGGTNNSATITINSNNVSSSILQNARAVGAATPDASGNRAVALHVNSPAVVNPAAGAATVLTQDSQIAQQESGNSASVVISGGSTARGTAGTRTANLSGVITSRVTQQNSFFQQGATAGTFTAGAPTSTNNPNTGNVADVSLTGVGHSTSIFQDGVQNSVSLSVFNRGSAGVSNGEIGTNNTLDAGTGLTFSGGQSGGNSATFTQQGQNNRANVSVGGRDAAQQQGLGNRLTVTQGNGAALGSNHSATVFQFGQLSSISIEQQNNTAVAGGAGAVQDGSVADVSQSAFFSTMTLTQRGSNTAVLSQGGGSSDVGTANANGTGGQSGNNTLTVTQTDTGQLVAGGGGGGGDTPGGFDPAPAPGPAPTGARNTVEASQAGRNNSASITQNATQASATLFVRRGSANLVTTINQGTGAGFGAGTVGSTGGVAGATRVFANVTQGGLGGSIDVRQNGSVLNATVEQNNGEFSTGGRSAANGGAAGSVAPVVQISQVGQLNTARVTQTGSNSTATVDQRNNNGRTASSVTISQSGGSSIGNNTAVARQTFAGEGEATLGASTQTGPNGDAETRLAGSISANVIEITQTNTSSGTAAAGTRGNNSATVEQGGSGQVGRITQNGFRNEAGILQTAGATNSTAIISQTGADNTFFVTQNSPNQFVRATQTGGNNQVINGTGTDLGGSTSNTVRPGFTTTP